MPLSKDADRLEQRLSRLPSAPSELNAHRRRHSTRVWQDSYGPVSCRHGDWSRRITTRAPHMRPQILFPVWASVRERDVHGRANHQRVLVAPPPPPFFFFRQVLPKRGRVWYLQTEMSREAKDVGDPPRHWFRRHAACRFHSPCRLKERVNGMHA